MSGIVKRTLDESLHRGQWMTVVDAARYAGFPCINGRARIAFTRLRRRSATASMADGSSRAMISTRIYEESATQRIRGDSKDWWKTALRSAYLGGWTPTPK